MSPELDLDLPENQGIVPADIVRQMEDSYLDYAMSVIVSRALPDVRDGLKPVHRRILYAMKTLGLVPGGKYRKSATVVGEVLGKYHPHGDSAVYQAMVRMAQDFSLRYPLVEGQGNFGSVDGDNAAAMRYTEAKMAKLTPEMLEDIDKNTVEFIDNYDGSQQEPTVLPAKVPNLLLNGVGGIAVGMATNIPPHNLGELIDATIMVIDNPEATVEDLMTVIPGPDFPTGGIIYDVSEIKRAYATGRGKVVMRGKAEIEEMKKGKFAIIVTEIPYQVNKSTLIEKIADLANNKIIVGISDLRDESDREGMRIVVELKKDAYPQKVLNQLYKMTQLQDSFHVNMIALVAEGRQPRLLSLKTILEEYVEHRKIVLTRRTQYELGIAEARAHILEGLKIALDFIDAVIATIRASKDKDEAREALMSKFSLSDKQAQAILDMRLQTLAGLERKRIDDEYQEKMTFIADCHDILARPERILTIIRDDLVYLKTKFADERRSKIVLEGLDGFRNEDLIPNEPMIITLTVDNYVKRMSPSTYKSQKRGGKGVIGVTTKEEDIVDQIVVANTHDDLLLFTDRGRVFQVKVYELPVASRTAKGQAIVNLLSLEKEEKVTTLLALEKNRDTAGKFLFMSTTDGTVKKTELSQFKNIRKSGLIAISLREGDLLRWVKETNGSNEIMLITRQGQSIRFSEDDVRSMGRSSMGVRGIKLKKQGDKVVEMVVIQDTHKEVMTITENGFGKSTPLVEYSAQNRGGSGVKTHELGKKTGPLAGAKVIENKEGDLILMSEQGQVIRLAMTDVKTSGRATLGVTVMRMKESGDKISGISLMQSEPDEEILEGEDVVNIAQSTDTLVQDNEITLPLDIEE